jgi:transposase
MIRTDVIWLATEPADMRSGIESLLAHVVQVFRQAQPHHAYLFANARANGLKLLAHDGQGIWLVCRRLNL